MVDISNKLKKIIALIDDDQYFTINRARQYGKTTTLTQVYHKLKHKYLVLEISFEGLGEKAFESDRDFCITFVDLIKTRLEQNNVDFKLLENWSKDIDKLDRFELLSKKITGLVKASEKEIVLLIDEVDKSSNNQLFLHFLGMLRNKYLDRSKGYDHTFKSVILAGVYDVKNLKLKLREDDERKYNSPWNIAADFNVDMSFNPDEISTMLKDYEKDHKEKIDIENMSNEIFQYTNGYPFLVSKLCKIIDEELCRNWTSEGITEAVKVLLHQNNTLFDDLIKNIENNKELYEFVYDMLILGVQYSYTHTDPVINIGMVLGIFTEDQKKVKIHNQIFETLIYDHMSIAKARKDYKVKRFDPGQFIDANKDLNIIAVLDKFQELMQTEYRKEDEKFIEREGRLIFLAFIKPIINGVGNYFIEAQTRNNKRMDIVITYNRKKYIIELKIWRGQESESNAILQLSDYLDIQNETKGYLIIFNFNKNKEYKKELKQIDEKQIYEVIV